MRSVVDLPQPDGPTSTVNDPSVMSMSTPCRMGTSPKFFLTERMVTLAMLPFGLLRWTRLRQAVPAGAKAQYRHWQRKST